MPTTKAFNRNRAGYASGNIAAAARSLNVSRAPRYSTVQKYAIRFGVVRIDIGQRHCAAGKAISLRYTFRAFHFVLEQHRAWRRYVMNPEVEVLLVWPSFGDIYPVKYRTPQTAGYLDFRAYGFPDQIVQILGR